MRRAYCREARDMLSFHIFVCCLCSNGAFTGCMKLLYADDFTHIVIFVYVDGASWNYKTNNIYSSFKDA